MLNHDFTGYWMWVFQLLLLVLWLAGPIALLGFNSRRTHSRSNLLLGWAAVTVGVAGFAIKLGWFTAVIDLLIGVAVISSARHPEVTDDAATPANLFGLPTSTFVVIGLLIAMLSFTSITLPRARHAGTTGMVDRLDACGRSYRGPGGWYNLQDMRSNGLKPVAVAQVQWRNLEIWGEGNGMLDAFCGTAVYVRTSGDTFRGYALLGSP